MSVESQYATILANLARERPLDLDPEIFDAPEPCQVHALQPSDFPVPPAIWTLPDENQARIGLRIKEPIENADFLAARLAAIALERQVYPVFLSYIAQSGMQRFGFRVEQLFGLQEHTQKEFEQQLAQFWRLSLVIDATEIAILK